MKGLNLLLAFILLAGTLTISMPVMSQEDYESPSEETTTTSTQEIEEEETTSSDSESWSE